MQRTLHYPNLRNLKSSHRKRAVNNFEYSGGDKRSRVRITDDSAKVGHGPYEVIGHTRNKTLRVYVYCCLLAYHSAKSGNVSTKPAAIIYYPEEESCIFLRNNGDYSYHNAWRHNPTDSSLRCHSFHNNKYLSSTHSTSHDGGEGAEVFPIRNNAWHLWGSGCTAPLINLSEINGQPQVR